LCFGLAFVNAFFAVGDDLVGFACNFISGAKLGVVIVMVALSYLV
jgi:hypothetical protein